MSAVTVSQLKKAIEEDIAPKQYYAQMGNCGLFAAALHDIIGGGTFWASYNQMVSMHEAAHVMLEWRGLLWDSDGYYEPERGKAMLEGRAMRSEYSSDTVRVVDSTKQGVLKDTVPVKGWSVKDFLYIIGSDLDVTQNLQDIMIEGDKVGVEKVPTKNGDPLYRFTKGDGGTISASTNKTGGNRHDTGLTPHF